jgi:hypothetical protein|tara:strand:+ start:182 stop:712 length:531 start_codon:yes stop_codon:yes gene_type:complete
MIKVISNVLTTDDCFSLYSGLVGTNMWNLNRSSLSGVGGSFPGVNLIEDEKIVYNDQYWIGYFNCLFDRLNVKLQEQHNFSLKRIIKRLALNAANDNHYTEFHQDTIENYYSIVGFFTPQWAEDWGGELNIEGKIIKYNPGDFILFDSCKLHKSEKIKKIPYWRTSVSYVIKSSRA